MKITAKNSPVNLETYKNIKNKKKTGALSEQASGEIYKKDRVVLSSKAREIREAKKILNSLPDIRKEKVAHLTKQIKNGTYQINKEKIAVKMLKESLDIEYLRNPVDFNQIQKSTLQSGSGLGTGFK